jgi:4-hydroxy-tetrahydrodipicolinate reductase
MNIALIGYGRMGKEVENLAASQGVNVVAKFDIEDNPNGSGLDAASLRDAHVCIEFSVPDVVITNLRKVAECGKNIVIGTTGWGAKVEEAKRIVEERKIGLVYSSNFSIGMNVFMKLIERAARMFNHFEEYDVSVHEVHHKEKVDSPSGTALEIGKILLKHSERKKRILTEKLEGKIPPDELQISSTRVGSIAGIHTVTFDSSADTIELKHTAKTRAGFALGALLAAKWVNGKQGFYTMSDVLENVLR